METRDERCVRNRHRRTRREAEREVAVGAILEPEVRVEVRPERRTALAMRWLILYTRERGEKSLAEKLAAEVIAGAKGEGNAVKKKEDTHKMAEANKAFSHFRF